MNSRLDINAYILPAVRLAPLLLGKLLCVRRLDSVIKTRITQTECYCGETDTASHARRGRTKGTEPLYSEGGIAYVYLCYGMHAMFNVVCGAKGVPESVFIRGIAGYETPGRLNKALGIDKSFNGENLSESERVWIEDDGYVAEYESAKRIGIPYASRSDVEKPWRFIAK